VDASPDRDGPPVEPEAARDGARPEVEPLLDLRDVCGARLRAVASRQPQAELAEVQAVRVLAQPVE
jgi:hypothetical protein